MTTGVAQAISEAGRGSTVLGVAFTGDGQRLVQAGTDGRATIVDVRNGAMIGEPFRISDGFVWDIAFNADDTQLAAGGDNGIVLWDLVKQSPIGEPLTSQATTVYAVALSPDGTLLAAGGDDGAIVLWEITVAAWQARACEIIHGNMDAATWARYMGDEPYHETCPDEDRSVLPPAPIVGPAATPDATPVGRQP